MTRVLDMPLGHIYGSDHTQNYWIDVRVTHTEMIAQKYGHLHSRRLIFMCDTTRRSVSMSHTTHRNVYVGHVTHQDMSMSRTTYRTVFMSHATQEHVSLSRDTRRNMGFMYESHTKVCISYAHRNDHTQKCGHLHIKCML